MPEARPDVTGKGPTLVREMLAVFGEINSDLKNVDAATGDKVKTVLVQKSQAIEPLLKRPFMKTVKAGEMSWDCKQTALALRKSVQGGEAETALKTMDELNDGLDQLIDRIQTFVVRMT